MAWDVSVLTEEEDVLTVCKPASVPVRLSFYVVLILFIRKHFCIVGLRQSDSTFIIILFERIRVFNIVGLGICYIFF